MIKDEIGFLSEWTAFYEMQGFDKVIFYDNNSTTSFAELQPWIKTGFVEIISSWYNDRGLFRNKKRKFQDMMYVKFLAETDCKDRAAKAGFDLFVSVDLDEYVFPTSAKKTVVDEMKEWFEKTTRGEMHRLPHCPGMLY